MSAKPTDQYWFVQQDGKQYGPYAFAALVEATNKGIITRRARVWHPTWSKWRFARNVPGLFAAQPSEHPDPGAKSPPGNKVPLRRDKQTFNLTEGRPRYATVTAPPPDDRLDAEPAFDLASLRRLLRVMLFLLMVAILCGAGWILIRWGVIDFNSLYTQQPPAATTPPAGKDKSANVPIADQSRAEALPDAVGKLPAVVALRRTDPVAFEKFSRRFTEGYTASATDQETLTLARTALRKSVKALLAKSPDEVILEITDIYLLYLRALRTTDAESCVALTDDGKGAKLTANLARDFPEIFTQDMKTLERIASTKVDSDIEIPTEQQVQASLANVFAQLRTKPLQMSLFNSSRLAPAEFGPYCDLVIAFYEAVRRLPQSDSAKLLRYLYAAAAAEPDAAPPQQPSAKE